MAGIVVPIFKRVLQKHEKKRSFSFLLPMVLFILFRLYEKERSKKKYPGW